MKAEDYIDQIIKLTKMISYACLISEDADTSRQATSERAEVIKELLKLYEVYEERPTPRKLSILISASLTCKIINGEIPLNRVKVLSMTSIGHHDYSLEIEGAESDVKSLLFKLGI